MMRVYKPLYTCNYPTANRIAAELVAPLLQLSTGLLVRDIREKFNCAQSTAMRAVGIARKRLTANAPSVH